MRTLSCLLAASLLSPLPASADVAIRTLVKSGGYRGVGASQTDGTRYISGLKAREEGDSRMTGAVLGRLSGVKETAHILRLDLDKRWSLDLKKKTYTEGPLKVELPKEARPEASEAKPGAEEKPTHRVKSAKAEVKKAGESKTINGFKTEKWTATLAVVVEEIATKKTSEFVMETQLWAAPWNDELRQATEEEARFAKAYLKKLGLDLSPEERDRFGADGARLLLASAGPEVEGALKKLGRELSALDGYPVVTETTWRNPAEEAPAAKGAPERDDEGGSALGDAARSGSLGGAAMGFLGGMAKKAASKKIQEKVQESMGKPAFSVRTEVRSVETSAIPADKFEVPEGFSKRD